MVDEPEVDRLMEVVVKQHEVKWTSSSCSDPAFHIRLWVELELVRALPEVGLNGEMAFPSSLSLLHNTLLDVVVAAGSEAKEQKPVGADDFAHLNLRVQEQFEL
jgi:hypothetical protein